MGLQRRRKTRGNLEVHSRAQMYARALAFFAAVLLCHRAVDAATWTSALTINEPFTATSTTLTISFTITGTDTGKEDTIKLVLPNYWLDSTTTTTTANCGGATFTVAATGGAGATATSDLTFTAATADVAAGTACTITTHISQARTSAAAVPANSDTITLQFIDG